MHEDFSIENVLYSKHLVVAKERESLADYIRRVRRERELSLNDIRVRSGYQIVNSYISRIENGEVTNVGIEKLRVLAKGLGVTEEEIFAVARGKSESDEVSLTELRLLGYFRELPVDKQSDVLAYVEMMHDRYSAEPLHAESLPHGGRQTIKVRAGKYVSQHTERALRKKQG